MQKINTKNLILCALFSALIAVGAFIRIPIPVVPFTLQFLFTMLAGLLIGGKLGFTSVTVYIAMGLLGLPVFADGGGLAYLLKPSFGYIIGFAVLFFLHFGSQAVSLRSVAHKADGGVRAVAAAFKWARASRRRLSAYRAENV